jgi:hypothetical protein
MIIPDHIFESLETVFWVKNTYFLLFGSGSGFRNPFDPGSGMEKIRIRDKHSGFATVLGSLLTPSVCGRWAGYDGDCLPQGHTPRRAEQALPLLCPHRSCGRFVPFFTRCILYRYNKKYILGIDMD